MHELEEHDLMPMAEAAEAAGLTIGTLRRRLAAAGRPTYTDPMDARRRLVDRGDLRALLMPTPIALAPRRDGRRVA